MTSSSTQTVLVCAGHGFDSAATGIIATIVIPSAIGLILWVGNFFTLYIVFLVQPRSGISYSNYIARVRRIEAPFPTNLLPSRVVCSTQVSFCLL